MKKLLARIFGKKNELPRVPVRQEREGQYLCWQCAKALCDKDMHLSLSLVEERSIVGCPQCKLPRPLHRVS